MEYLSFNEVLNQTALGLNQILDNLLETKDEEFYFGDRQAIMKDDSLREALESNNTPVLRETITVRLPNIRNITNINMGRIIADRANIRISINTDSKPLSSAQILKEIMLDVAIIHAYVGVEYDAVLHKFTVDNRSQELVVSVST